MIPKILDMVDAGRIAFTIGVELSYLTEEEQYELYAVMDLEQCTPSLSQANKMERMLSNFLRYSCKKMKGHILEDLPDFDLEELVIAYLQLEKNYYVLSNSIANKSTTIKVECELIGRDKNKKEKAVGQVKGGKTKFAGVHYEVGGFVFISKKLCQYYLQEKY